MVPKVTVVMPCYNEERFIGRAIESLVGFVRSEPTEKNEINGVRPYYWNIEADDYFRENCELILVDGMSSDRTKEVILTFIEGNEAKKLGLQREGQIKLLENKERTQSHGLNLGIKEARGEIICRADAHCIFPPGYVRRCVELLEATGAANVGGVMVPVTDGPNANSGLGSDAGPDGSGSWSGGSGQEVIALALRHPVGVGDATWHLGNYTGFVDTVYLGMFYRKLFDEIGLFDPKASPNEDGELNLRILKAGKRIYLDSSIRVVYFPRETLRKLAKQYFRYGKGRAYTTFKHRRVTSWRQVGPWILVIALILSVVAGVWKPVFLLLSVGYALGLFLTALASWPGKRIPLKIRALVAVAWGIMHVSWGAGFIYHFVRRK